MIGSYRVFTRNWWKRNPAWPNGLEPDPHARKVTLRTGLTYDEARRFCEEYNKENKPTNAGAFLASILPHAGA